MRVGLTPYLKLTASAVSLFLPVVLWLGAPSFEGSRVSPLYLASLWVVGLIAVFMLGFEAARAPYSLHLVHWIFIYVFFFVVPLVQYKVGIFPWERLTSANLDTLLAANLAILLWCASWIVSRLLQLRSLAGASLPAGPRISVLGVFLTLALAFGATFYLVLTLGSEAILTRAGYGDAFGNAFTVSSTGAIVDKLLRGIPVAAVAGTLWLFQRKRFVSRPLALLLVLLSLALLLVANFPLSAARYWAGSIYLGLFLTLLAGRLKNGWIFVLIMVFSLLLVFPVLGATRDATSLPQTVAYAKDALGQSDTLARGDFDAYAMVGYTAEYIDEGPGPTNGRQLLGAALFFVPREFWFDKPVGSGYTVAQERGLSFDNVSSPPVAEGLINFGWPGIVLFAVALSWLFGVLDAAYRVGATKEARGVLLHAIYPFWIGMAFFLLRGDLLSSTAFITGFTAAFATLAISTKVLSRHSHFVSTVQLRGGYRKNEIV